MKNLSYVANNLFNKIRGRFSDVTIGDEDGTVTNIPEEARYFDFSYMVDGVDLGKVSVNISEDTGLTVIMSQDFASEQTDDIQNNWYSFLKELRLFAKKNMMNFDVRDINKNNLTKRDYSFLANKTSGDETMAESKMYGTNKTSYQRIGNARLAIKHIAPINVESATGRTQKINAIYIESPTGERFKYPYKHLSGARAMAMHVSEGGNAYDDFGKYISGLSEEISKLRKFSQYINRSSVVAEGLADYVGIVKERVVTIKKEIQNLQKPSYYSEAVSSYTVPVVEDVPDDVSENWIDQLTIKQFNEELKDVFPYIYKLVGEATKAKELGPDDLIDESGLQYYTGVKKHGKEYMKKAAQAGREGASQEELGRLKDKYSKAEKKTKEEFELEQAFEDTMGQFSDHVCEDCGNPSWRTLSEEKQKGVDGKVCWKGYKRMGTKMKGGKRVDNCVKVSEDASAPSIDNIRTVMQINGAQAKRWDSTIKIPGMKWSLDNQAYIKIGQMIQSGKDASSLIQQEIQKIQKLANFIKQNSVDPRNQVHKAIMSLLQQPSILNSLEQMVRMLSQSGSASEAENKIGEAYINTSKDAIAVLGNLRKIGKSIELGQGAYNGNLAGEYVNDVYDVISWLEANADTRDPKFQQVIRPVIELRKKAKSMEREPGSGKDAAFGNEIVNTLYPLMQWIEMNVQAGREADVGEGFKSKLAMLALLGLTGLGAMKMTDPTNSPLGQALQQAAQQGDEEAAYHLKKLGAYIDAGDSGTLKQLNFQYIDEPESMKDNADTPSSTMTAPMSMSQEKPKTPLGEFILSYFDRENGTFPKGPTAVLTMVEKDYGTQYVKPAAKFIQKVEATVAKRNAQETLNSRYPQTEIIKQLAGL